MSYLEKSFHPTQRSSYGKEEDRIVRVLYSLILLLSLSFCSLPNLSRNPLEFFSLFRLFNTSSEYILGGSVLGMVPGGSVLIKNGGEEITVTADGNFSFSSRFPTGTPYAVSITPSSNMNCTLSNGSGTFQTANITTVAINCSWGSNFHELAVNVNGTAASFSVQNNGSDSLSISTLGLQPFSIRIANGAAYDIRFTSQPSGAVCSFDTPTLSRANMPNNSLTVQITCKTGNLVAGNLQVNALSDIATNLYDQFAYVRTLVGAYPLNRPGGVGASPGLPNVGTATGDTVRFNNPKGIAFDSTHMYVADFSNNAIRKIDKTNGDTTHFAGSSVGAGVVCPGIPPDANCKDGIALDAQFNGPVALTTDGNNLYVLELIGNRIRKVSLANAEVSTLAGDGSPGSINSTTGINARFSSPSGITLRNQILYVVDRNNCTIRSVDTVTTEVTTIAGIPSVCTHNDHANGSLATFTSPLAAVAYGNYLYVTDVGGHRIRRINLVNGTFSVDTIAGDGTPATIDGIGTQASFFDPHGITTDGTTLFISEWVGQTIRAIRLSDFQVKTLAGDGTAQYEDNVRRNGRFNFPGSLTTDGIHVYIADDQNHSIRRLETAEVVRYTLDGNSLDTIGTNHASTIGTTTISSDEKGTASGSFVFDGATYLESGSNINLDDHRNLTITAWVFPTTTSASNQYIFFNGQGVVNGYGLVYNPVTRRIQVNIPTVGSSGFSSRALPLNRWSHVALHRRDGSWQLYINGQPETIIFINNPISPTGNFKIGDSGSSFNFQGKISNVRFFRGALDNSLMQALALQIPNGVVSYYAFNGNLNDFGGSGNHLTNSGAVLTPDRYGHTNGAYFFNGVAFLQRTSPNALPIGNSARTICAWFEPTSNANQSLISYGLNAAGQGVAIGYNGINVAAIGVGADAFGPHGGFQNDWALACSVYDGTTASIYINGALYGTNAVAWNTAVGPDLFVGQDWSGGARFTGSIDELIIYNRALNQTELRALAGYYPTQVSSWSPTIASSSLKFYLKPESTLYSSGVCPGPGTDCVSDWFDRSGNGIHLIQGLGLRQPFYSAVGMNNSKAVRFTRGGVGSETFMTGACSETLNTTSQSIFVAYSEIILGPTNNDGIFQNGSPSTGKLLYITRAAGNNPNLFDLQGGSTRLVSTLNFHNTLDNNLLTMIHDGTTGSLFRNGSIVSASSSAGGAYNCGGGQFHLGRYFYGGTPDGNYFNGFIGDVLIYNTALPTNDRFIVECYLSSRYKLPVPYTCP
ncbi:MAG: concanavalin [Leptospira sp.]|nr:concanavalin [Leptospira sp.]